MTLMGMMLRRHHVQPDHTPAHAVDEPPADPIDPADFTVEQVLEYLALAIPEDAAALIEQEKAGKARKGIVEWKPSVEA